MIPPVRPHFNSPDLLLSATKERRCHKKKTHFWKYLDLSDHQGKLLGFDTKLCTLTQLIQKIDIINFNPIQNGYQVKELRAIQTAVTSIIANRYKRFQGTFTYLIDRCFHRDITDLKEAADKLSQSIETLERNPDRVLSVLMNRFIQHPRPIRQEERYRLCERTITPFIDALNAAQQKKCRALFNHLAQLPPKTLKSLRPLIEDFYKPDLEHAGYALALNRLKVGGMLCTEENQSRWHALNLSPETIDSFIRSLPSTDYLFQQDATPEAMTASFDFFLAELIAKTRTSYPLSKVKEFEGKGLMPLIAQALCLNPELNSAKEMLIKNFLQNRTDITKEKFQKLYEMTALPFIDTLTKDQEIRCRDLCSRLISLPDSVLEEQFFLISIFYVKGLQGRDWNHILDVLEVRILLENESCQKQLEGLELQDEESLTNISEYLLTSPAPLLNRVLDSLKKKGRYTATAIRFLIQTDVFSNMVDSAQAALVHFLTHKFFKDGIKVRKFLLAIKTIENTCQQRKWYFNLLEKIFKKETPRIVYKNLLDVEMLANANQFELLTSWSENSSSADLNKEIDAAIRHAFEDRLSEEQFNYLRKHYPNLIVPLFVYVSRLNQYYTSELEPYKDLQSKLEASEREPGLEESDSYEDYQCLLEERYSMEETFFSFVRSLLKKGGFQAWRFSEEDPHLKKLKSLLTEAGWKGLTTSSKKPLNGSYQMGVLTGSDDSEAELFFRVGEKVGSCQDYRYRHFELSIALLGYTHGKCMVAGVWSRTENYWISRAIMRALIDDKGQPILLLEKRYGSQDYHPSVVEAAKAKAAEMGIPLYTTAKNYEASLPPVQTILSSLSGRAFEYVDSIVNDEVQENGKYQITNMENPFKVLYQPL